jgi:hypothetical protein
MVRLLQYSGQGAIAGFLAAAQELLLAPSFEIRTEKERGREPIDQDCH